MATYQTPKRATAWIGYIFLPSQATPVFQANPTLAAGDAKVSIDGGALANLATLPTVTPAAGKMVKVSLSAAEMNGDNITVVLSDAAGAEWCDVVANIQTSARQIDDLAFPATSGRSMVVDAAGLVDANTVKVGPTGAGTAQTAGDIFARIGAPAGASIAADVAAIKTDTANIYGKVDTEVASIIATLGTPAGVSMSADIAAVKTDTANVAAIKLKTDNLPPDPADESAIIAAIAAVSAPTANENADALLDRAAGVETGLTFRQAMRLIAAVLLGKASGMSSTTAVFRDTNDTKDRIQATVDADGNRSSVIKDAT
jgi:hypothetical protein